MTNQHRIGNAFLRSLQPIRLLAAITVSLQLAALGGCEASGSSERATSYLYAPVPVHQVDVYFEPVRSSYDLIATLSAEASVSQFGSAAEAEAAVYEKLRSLAAKNGATAVIDIEVTPADISLAEVISAEAKAVRFR